jgi:transposase
VRLRFDEDAWKRRRRFDGFVLLVAPPQMSGSASELVQLYRAKDAVEKDFQTIKTDLKLRPVFHHTNPKVRAHVTLCMLALLLERTLDDRLRRAKQPMTAPACIEELASARLNMLRSTADTAPSYVVTEPTAQQQAILRSLRMTTLIKTDEVAGKLHPRPTP